MVRRRLVLYLGYDSKSRKLLKRVMMIKDLFDEVRVIHIPEYSGDVLENLSLPALMVEELTEGEEVVVSRLSESLKFRV